MLKVAATALLAVAGGVACQAAAAADPSPGCDRPAPSSHPPDRFLAGGVERRAIVVTPPGATGRPVPLVIAFHGRTNDNAKARGYLGLEEAAAGPAVFAYPAARRGPGGFTWAAPGGDAGPDLALFDALLAWIGRTHCIDRAAVFLVGHSLGASFANGVACARGPAVVQGLASAAGGIAGGGAGCRGRVPALLLHNPRDELVPLSEGERARDALLGAPMPGLWPVAETLPGGFACLRAGGGGGGAPLLWCLHRQDRTRSGRPYPHRWPDGASRLVMSFFAGLAR